MYYTFMFRCRKKLDVKVKLSRTSDVVKRLVVFLSKIYTLCILVKQYDN